MIWQGGVTGLTSADGPGLVGFVGGWPRLTRPSANETVSLSDSEVGSIDFVPVLVIPVTFLSQGIKSL